MYDCARGSTVGGTWYVHGSRASPLETKRLRLLRLLRNVSWLLGYSAPWLLRGYSVAAPRLLLGWLLRGYSVATPCLLRSCRSGNCRSYSVATPLLRLLTDILTYSVATPWRLRAYSYSVATQLLG